ncbi:MAG TPA: discoidin domain-containing protein [Candidatus Limnocylindria bacterium]|nr:discoidin domain-containing protein [Candidatus Limnocylindria bacterium]
MSEATAAGRGLRVHAGAIAVALAVALAETWPLATRLDSAFPSQRAADAAAPSPGPDQLLIAWIHASNARRLGENPLHVFETNNMHPFWHTLAYSENLLGLTLPVWPVHAAWKNPVLTSNLALLVALAVSAYGVQLLVIELTGSRAAAAVAAVLAIYAPGVWGRIDQMHVTTGVAAALAFVALHRLIRTRRLRHVVALGMLLAWQAWASLHWGLFLALGMVAGVLVLLAADRDARRALPALALAAALAAALTVPLALPYLAVAREMDLTERGMVAFLSPAAILPPLWRAGAYLVERAASGERLVSGTTLALWLPIAAGLLATAVAWRPRRVPAAALAAIAAGIAVNYWYACGPRLGAPPLQRLLADVPGMTLVRVPARAIVYCQLMLAVLAGCGTAAVLRRLRPRAARVAVVVGLVALAVVEAGWRGGALAPAPGHGVPVPPALARLPADCAVAEIPTDFAVQAKALYRSIGHGRPLVNGRSGFYPVSPFVETRHLNAFPSDDAQAYLRAAGACAVIVRLDAPASRRILAASQARGLRPRNLTAAYDAMLIVLPPAPPEPSQAPRLAREGWRIVEPATDTAPLVDGSLDTLRIFRVRGADGPERLAIDLGRVQSVSGVDVSLGTHFRRYLWTYRVEGSVDGAVWTTLAESANAIPPFASYRADPTRIVQRIRFPPARARFVRLGPYRSPPRDPYSLAPDAGFFTWGVAEIDVAGAPARRSS